MRKMDRMRTLFAVCEPDPLAVATCSEKSLATTSEDAPARDVVSVRTLDILVFPPGPRPSWPWRARGKMRPILTPPGRAWKNRCVRIVSLCPSITESLAALGLAGEPRRRHALLRSPARGARGRPARRRHEEPRSRGDSRPEARSRLLQRGGEPGRGHRGAEAGVRGGRLAPADGGGDPGAPAAFRGADGDGEKSRKRFL